MSTYLLEYSDISALYELPALMEIVIACETMHYEQEPDSPDPLWNYSTDLFGYSFEFRLSAYSHLPQAADFERPDWEYLQYKVIGMLKLPEDLAEVLPLEEPELCILGHFTYCDGEPSDIVEIYVRESFLQLPTSRPFANALLKEKLRKGA